MATQSSIGSASRNYSTVAAWHAAFANGGWEGLMYADSEFVTTAAVTIGGTSAVNYELLTTAAGQSIFDNSANKITYDSTKGVCWKQTANYATQLTLSSYVTVSKIAFWNQGQGNDTRVIEAATFSSTFGLVIDKCLCISDNTFQAYASGAIRAGGQGDVLITNSVIVANQNSINAVKLSYANSVVIVNCTIVCPANVGTSATTAFADVSSNAQLHIYNTAVFGFSSWTGAGGSFVGSNNATDNASIPGTDSASLKSQTYSSCFVNPTFSGGVAAADFKISSSSPLKDAGADKHATYGQVANDIFGTARPAGASYDIGAYEYVSAGSPYSLSAGQGTVTMAPQSANLVLSRTTTRFYLQNATADYSPATLRGAWDSTASAVTKKMARAKSGASTTVAIAETSTTNNFNVLLGRFVSEAFTNNFGFLTSNTVQWIAMVTESSASAHDFFHVHAYVTSGNSDTPRGTLLTDNIGATEWTTTNTGRGEGTKTVSSLSAQVGDRLVVEIGYQAQNTSATSFTGTLRYGGTGADSTQGTTTSTVGWVEIVSNGDPFGTPKAYSFPVAYGAFAVSGQAAALSKGTAGATLTASQGSVGVSGQATALKVGHTISVAFGGLAANGQAAGLARGRYLAADFAGMIVTGKAAGLSVARSLTADYAGLGLAGQSVGLNRSSGSKTLSAGFAACGVNGFASGLLVGRKLGAAQASFGVAPQSAGLIRGRGLVASQGSVTESGQDANLRSGRILPLGFTLYADQGMPASLWHGRVPLTAAYGSFALSGQAVQFVRPYKLLAPAGAFLSSGEAARLRVIGWGQVAQAETGWGMQAGSAPGWSGAAPSSDIWAAPTTGTDGWSGRTGTPTNWN